MPDFYSTGSDQPDDLTAGLVQAVQAAQMLQRQGVRAVPNPTELPPLNIAALLRMNPVQAATVIRARNAQARRNAASDQNYDVLLSKTFQKQAEQSRFDERKAEHDRRLADENAQVQKERENQASEYAAQIGDVLPKYQEATAAKDKADADLAEIARFATAQRARGTVGFMPDKVTKPDPKTGIFIVPTGTFNPLPVTPTDLNSNNLKANSLANKDKWEPEVKRQFGVHGEVAAALNDEFTKRTDTANKAIAHWQEVTNELQEADKSLRKPGFLLRDGAVHDVFTKKSYPLDSRMKNFEYNPKTFQLVPQ